MASRNFMRSVQGLFGQRHENDGNSQQQQQPNRNRATGNSSTGAANNDGNIAGMDLDALLRSVLGGVNDSFDAATRAAMEASMREQQEATQPQGAPPASERALKALPLVQIRPEDLTDPANRECAICLEPHELRGQALRLPCSHLYHRSCCLDWLRVHCTCPICRYELATDDPQYEQGRQERMRHRKPRYARHELERMTVRELKQLVPLHRRGQYQAVDRADLVDHIIASDYVDLVPAPEPVEYSMSALQQMSVSQLKRCMNDEAGVFFDPRDVVEKGDMITIFLASGRLVLLPEDEEMKDDSETDAQKGDNDAASDTNNAESAMSIDNRDTTTTAAAGGPAVETVSEPAEAQTDLRKDRTLVMEECSVRHLETEAASNGSTEDDYVVVGAEEGGGEASQQEISDEAEAIPRQPGAVEDEVGTEEEEMEEDKTPQLTAWESDGASGSDSRLDDASQNHSDQEMEVSGIVDSDSGERDPESQQNRKRSVDETDNGYNNATQPAAPTAKTTRFDGMSVSELRQEAQGMSVDLSGCIEKQDMVAALSRSEPSPASLFDDLGMSELLMVARLVGVNDLSTGDLVSTLIQEATERPHIARYVQSLKPFVRMSVPQLRAVARERGVRVGDCIEKIDILRRLVE